MGVCLVLFMMSCSSFMALAACPKECGSSVDPCMLGIIQSDIVPASA